MSSKYGYSSHGKFMPFSEFIELEVEERDNNTLEEVQEWQKKYNIDITQSCIWVTLKKRDVKEYCDYWNTDFKKIDLSNGFILEESYDGEGGYLFIKNRE